MPSWSLDTSPLHRAASKRAVAAVEMDLRARRVASEDDSATVFALLAVAEQNLSDLMRRRVEYEALCRRYQECETELAKREVLERYLRDTVVDAAALREDLRALTRALDLEAIRDRVAAFSAERAKRAEVALDACSSRLRSGTYRGDERVTLIERLSRVALESHRVGVRVAALQAITTAAEGLPQRQRVGSLRAATIRALAGLATATRQPLWVQAHALDSVAVLLGLEAIPVMARRLHNWGPGDDAVVRARAVMVLGKRIGGDTPLRLLRGVTRDPSEHVRQTLARTLGEIGGRSRCTLLADIMRDDASPRVRAVAAEALVAVGEERRDDGVAAETIPSALAPETHPLVLAVLLSELPRISGPTSPLSPSIVVPALVSLAEADSIGAELQEQSLATLRALEVAHGDELCALKDELLVALAKLDERDEVLLPISTTLSDASWRSALREAARGDMAVSARRTAKGWRLTRGEPRGLSLWRLLHELRTPAPDKRSGYPHATARRVRPGSVVVPPLSMAERTATRVPGERRWVSNLGGWASFLPRVDDLLAASAWTTREPLVLVTSAGAVTVAGPPTFFGRVRATAVLTWRFARYAEQRERALVAETDRGRRAYMRDVRALGFSVELSPDEGKVGGVPIRLNLNWVTRYLSFIAVPFMSPSWIDDLLQYGLSPRGNSLAQVAWFAWIVLAMALVRAAWSLGEIDGARLSIPLTLGGWGTRGKSGCERLKAALFQSLGYQVGVKTTGCEAMLLHALPDAPAEELFVYRAYDKATIWEQRDLLLTVAKLGVDVFLWECMALRERYVEVLLHQWMGCRTTTITNAHPDHEDVMGPSGEDVARVIAGFIPAGGHAVTAEDQMLPVLREVARRRGATLSVASRRSAELLPSDLLARFPYREHPANIALVAELAARWGIERDVALVNMADWVVPDIGVLKTYPVVEHRSRRLSFSNGMSANERVGFLSNWSRLGLAEHDPDDDEGTCVCTVVNNRADRVPRSRVFAQIMVEDAPCERQVVIGSNLGGMSSFVRQAREDYLATLHLDDEDRAASVERARRMFRRLAVPVVEGTLAKKLDRMAKVLGWGAIAEASEVSMLLGRLEAGEIAAASDLEAAVRKRAATAGGVTHPELLDDVARHARRAGWRVAVARRALVSIAGAVTAEDATARLRDAMRDLLAESVVFLMDPFATGDRIIDFVAGETPPGHDVHIVGAQNIKGAGLDFVYRWISIGQVQAQIDAVRYRPEARARALHWLLDHRDYGLYDSRTALAAVLSLEERASSEPVWAPHRAALARLVEVLSGWVAARERALRDTRERRTGWLLAQVERLIDPFDSIRRRRQARQVMSDLVARRMGRVRAALALRKITQRQKGGWLGRTPHDASQR